jgi:hypothetical protein
VKHQGYRRDAEWFGRIAKKRLLTKLSRGWFVGDEWDVDRFYFTKELESDKKEDVLAELVQLADCAAILILKAHFCRMELAALAASKGKRRR